MTDEVKVYVYGSCHFSGRLDTDDAVGNGGYGVVLNVNGQKVDEVAGGFSNTTNARMDIIGITEGLKRIKNPSNVTVYLSNGYVVDALTKGWLEKWKKNGFKKKKHVELWKDLDTVTQAGSHKLNFKHAKEVKYSKDFLVAEELGKKMSGKKNLPTDLKSDNGIFEIGSTNGGEIINPLEFEDDTPILDSVSVDASSIGNPGPTEYRGVETKTGKVIFQMKYEKATNNIGEFLAIVHALALFKKEGKELNVIYSDSVNAISWVKQKKCKTKFDKTEENSKVFDHLDRAVKWLQTNTYETKILKWNTAAWGEIPADYGRK
jgi:ribonuclease HI